MQRHFQAMPPKRKAATSSTPRKRRTTRRQPKVADDIPEIFQEMLAEVATSSQVTPPPQPYIGRRKASEEPPEDAVASQGSPAPGTSPGEAPEPPSWSQSRSVQVVYNDFDDSEDEDAEFEDVDLDAAQEVEEAPEQKPLQLDLSASLIAPKRVLRRKLASGAERRLRLDVHKAHLLLLLGALQYRNQWCENEQVHAILKPLVSRKTISLIHVDDAKPQSERSRSFIRGIEELCALWRGLWSTTARGMRRAHWREDIDFEQEVNLIEDAIDFDFFKSAAQTRCGSRDLGAQLFCALLRSLAVDARLVCSLQALPFSAVAKGQTPEKPKPDYAYAPTQDFGSSSYTSTRSKIIDSPYPAYWVEVFSPATSNWIPLDPLVRNTVNKPRTGFEPPASDHLNSLCYVIAFEDDGTAKDVTLRYTTHFNSKTRKSRVESTKGGEEWWSRVMSHFEKPLPEVRDELEDAEFLKKAAQEGMPKNVADFKGHPVYVLERHLRRNEVIHPTREVGKVTIGGGDRKKLESVFRRRDVHLCRTNDAWYRRGRDVREGMKPLKYAAPRTRLEREEAVPEDEDTDVGGMALYAEYQTEVYVPPPVVNGRIPKNKFSNLDVYVESMIPAGAIHVRHPLAAKAAQVLGIDFADAVTGFEFKGRQGTALINGAIVSTGQRIAIVTVIVGLQSQMLEEVEAERSRITLSVWRRWLHALKIRERLEQEYGGQEDRESMHVDEGDDEQDPTYEDDVGGGFMPDPEQVSAGGETAFSANQMNAPRGGKQVALPPLPPLPEHHEIIVVESPHRLSKPQELPGSHPTTTNERREAGGFVVDNDEAMTDSNIHSTHGKEQDGGGFLPEQDIDTSSGGNFLPQDDMDNGGGGFLPEEVDEEATLIEPVPPSGSEKITVPAFHKYLTEHSRPPTNEVAAYQNDDVRHESDQTENLQAGGDNNVDKAQDDEVSDDDKGKGKNKAESDDSDSLMGSDTSMLSHDPAEEDAEPEWLLDSLSG